MPCGCSVPSSKLVVSPWRPIVSRSIDRCGFTPCEPSSKPSSECACYTAPPAACARATKDWLTTSAVPSFWRTWRKADALGQRHALRPHGRLRITAPIALATLRLAPALAEFSRQHPQLTLDLVLSDHLVDLTEEGIDMAIRIGRIGSDNLVARRIAETELLLAASPDYLATGRSSSDT